MVLDRVDGVEITNLAVGRERTSRDRERVESRERERERDRESKYSRLKERKREQTKWGKTKLG